MYELQPACPAGTVTDQPLLVAFGVALDDGGTATQLDGNSRCDERWQGCRLALTCVNQGILDVSFDSANDALTGTRSECDYCYPHDGGTPTRACQYRGVHN